MFVSEELKFVFIPVTKSGSSSVINALDNNFNGRRLQRNPRPPEQFRNYYLFCCVRNPYARMVSWWWTICKAEGDRYGHKRELRQHNLSESLFDFLTLWEIKGTYTQSSYMDRNPTMKKVLKLENLEEDFNTLPFVKTHIPMPRVNVRSHPPWQELLDARSGNLINRNYKTDFEQFNYEQLEFNDE